MQDYPSYWEQTTFLTPFDILIIGSGIVGCVAALHCASGNPGLRIGIVERGVLPTGASTRNAGFACFGSITEICKDIRTMGETSTYDLIAKRKSGLQQLFKLISPTELDYNPTGGYEVFLEQDEHLYQQCLKSIDDLNSRLISLFGSDPFVPDDTIAEKMKLKDIAHVIRHPFEGVLHPGKMMERFIHVVQSAGIAVLNGVEIQQLINEDTFVRIKGKGGLELKARYVIVATNAFANQLIPNLALIPARNQIYMTQPIPDLRLQGCFHYDHGFIYFREVDGRVLIGGARNLDFEGERTAEFGLTGQIRQRLTGFLSQHILPNTPFTMEYAWSGIIGIGDEKEPIIKMTDERIAVAVRLSGIGVAIGSLVGYQAAQLILARI
ncbi:MAG TPA: FAD-dependent oxidoreductase [Saprospiraceae bacterium]|nr:FAD-dependent oxidoreductase [Saprospiraceae bacterium]